MLLQLQKEIVAAKTAAGVLQLVDDRLHSFDSQHVATAIYRFQRWRVSDSVRSGKKLTQSSLKGFFLFTGPFLLIRMGVLQAVFSLRFRTFISLRKGKFVFQKSLSETPFKLDRLSFCTPNSGKSSATRGLPLFLGRGVCETKSKKGRARDRKPLFTGFTALQRGTGTMVSDHGLGRGQTMG